MRMMKLRFVRKKQEAGDIWSFWFIPLEPMSWIAGQSIRLEIPAGYDTDERRFTIASAPYEQEIMITTRLSGSVFKQGLETLAPETVVDGYAIEGDFVWEETDKPLLFVASGIGITPFRSMFLQRKHSGMSFNARLVYAARANETLFQAELSSLPIAITTLQDQRVTVESLVEAIPEMGRHLIYLSGPSKMVDQMARQLSGLKIPKVNIRTDRFTGNFQ